ncbi:transcription factor rf2b [Phtheirospermum japonicum]|uniref:Transcription factor rf2b n=1 Tax=Phtheirospermum japonicum TaxID=374723 RepID=A0A830C9G3_9LAMI|nr:transcription factor rf2b [Phtheirospermum japonicum]
MLETVKYLIGTAEENGFSSSPPPGQFDLGLIEIQQVRVAKTQILSFGYKPWNNKLSYVTQILTTRFFFLQRTTLNEALKHEVERLKCATSEISNSSNAFNLAMQHMPYNQSYYPSLSQSGPDKAQNVQMPQFHSLQTSMLGHHHQIHHQHYPMMLANHLRILSDSFQQDTLSSFQGLDIGTRGPPHLVKLKARRFQLVTALITTSTMTIAKITTTPEAVISTVNPTTAEVTTSEVLITKPSA